MTARRETEDPRRRLVLEALTAGLLSVTGSMNVLARDADGKASASQMKGKSIFRMAGTVLVNNLPATRETIIGPSDIIETGSRAELVFVSDSDAFMVRENSQLILNEGSTNERTAKNLRVTKGGVLAVFGKGQHRLTTMTAAIDIRQNADTDGAGFYVESDPEQTYFCTCYGKSQVGAIGDAESRQSIVSAHHDIPVYVLAGEPAGKNIRPAPFIDHTDPELMLIESLVGRTPPFVFPEDDYRGPRRDF
jgi:hypothetical protein